MYFKEGIKEQGSSVVYYGPYFLATDTIFWETGNVGITLYNLYGKGVFLCDGY